MEKVVSHVKIIYAFLKRNHNLVFFFGGFVFDVLTIKRIDALTDILIQIAYLLGLSFLLIYQYRANASLWTPRPWMAKLWSFNVEALHFLYGGLLSAYVILYLKSTSGIHGFLFLLFLVALMVLNEMPQIRRYGYRLRLGLYAFCITSFLIYFVAIVLGRMGAGVFYLAIFLSVIIVWVMAGALASKEAHKKAVQKRLFIPAAVLFLIVILLYNFHLIPPVPLSIQYQGIFHHILRDGKNYRLRYPKPPFYAFWRDDSEPFLARPGDTAYYFSRLFAPTRFKTKVKVRWEFYHEKKRKYITTDLIPMNIVGGRSKGYRGFVSKSNFKPGRWRVSTETEDERTIGHIKFRIKEDDLDKDRTWVDLSM